MGEIKKIKLNTIDLNMMKYYRFLHHETEKYERKEE